MSRLCTNETNVAVSNKLSVKISQLETRLNRRYDWGKMKKFYNGLSISAPYRDSGNSAEWYQTHMKKQLSFIFTFTFYLANILFVLFLAHLF